jgi:NAD(P)-dependent dehydrogenase (short-subunit alcohol dehydrogenase family)
MSGSMANSVDGLDGALRGRTAIVTGGSSGIGRATALALAAHGCRVVIVGRDRARLGAVLEECLRSGVSSDAVMGLSADMTLEADTRAMADRTVARFGRIDILVACAGAGRPPGAGNVLSRPVAGLTSSDWDAVMRANLTGTFLSNRAVLPAMIANRHGDIVNVSSARGATRGQAFAAPYCASKFAIVGLTQALAAEVARQGIRVQVLLPDVTRTPLLERTTMIARLGPLLSPDRVGHLIVTMLALPRDTMLDRPRIAPFATGPARSDRRAP